MKKKGTAIIGFMLLLVLLLIEITPAPVAAGADWVGRFNAAASGEDSATAIAVDPWGNVYVTGNSYGGAVTGIDYLTMKYNSSGVLQWARRYNGTGSGDDYAKAIVWDRSGNIYVTGYSIGTGGNKDYATIKYSAGGTQTWVKRYNGTGDYDDEARAIAVDISGNVYVTGFCTMTTTYQDYVTIKYNAAGVQQWDKAYAGPADSADEANAMAVDSSGNVYVTGYCTWGALPDYVTVKYNTSGTLLWARRYAGPGEGYDIPYGIAVDGSGNVYVTGYCYWSVAEAENYVTIKYSPAGARLWVRKYTGPGSATDVAYGIATDNASNVYVTGASTGLTTDYDYATIKYDAAGTQKWVRRYDGIVHGKDVANAITLNTSWQPVVTGYCDWGANSNDYVTRKYSVAGGLLQSERYDGTGHSADSATAIAVHGANIYVTGASYGAGAAGADFLTIQY